MDTGPAPPDADTLTKITGSAPPDADILAKMIATRARRVLPGFLNGRDDIVVVKTESISGGDSVADAGAAKPSEGLTSHSSASFDCTSAVDPYPEVKEPADPNIKRVIEAAEAKFVEHLRSEFPTAAPETKNLLGSIISVTVSINKKERNCVINFNVWAKPVKEANL